MVRTPVAAYNPHAKVPARDRNAALDRLADRFTPAVAGDPDDAREARKRVLKEAIRTLLGRWGVAYSLFAIGYQAKWPSVGANP